jgi:hypothetical protein
MKGVRMRKKLIISSLLLSSTLSFSYDFAGLESGYSKEGFISMGFDTFFK